MRTVLLVIGFVIALIVAWWLVEVLLALVAFALKLFLAAALALVLVGIAMALFRRARR